jgi:hypothetical protein
VEADPELKAHVQRLQQTRELLRGCDASDASHVSTSPTGPMWRRISLARLRPFLEAYRPTLTGPSAQGPAWFLPSPWLWSWAFWRGLSSWTRPAAPRSLIRYTPPRPLRLARKRPRAARSARERHSLRQRLLPRPLCCAPPRPRSPTPPRRTRLSRPGSADGSLAAQVRPDLTDAPNTPPGVPYYSFHVDMGS